MSNLLRRLLAVRVLKVKQARGLLLFLHALARVVLQPSVEVKLLAWLIHVLDAYTHA